MKIASYKTNELSIYLYFDDIEEFFKLKEEAKTAIKFASEYNWPLVAEVLEGILEDKDAA